MPGPVSDSFDPEFGTGERAHEIDRELLRLYERLTDLLGGRPPMYILDLVDADLPERHSLTLSEREWRILRFAIERARDSI